MHARTTALLLTLLWLAGCTAPVPAVRPASPSPPRVEVRIEPLPSSEGWEVRYQFPAPIQAARFPRLGHGLRQAHWKVLEPAGVRIEALDRVDFLSTPDGAPFQTLRVRVSPFAVKPEKDYQPLIPFTAGGVLVYTEHFNVEPLPGALSAQAEPLPVETRFTLVPRPGERVVVAGRVTAGPVTWDAVTQGTYAFFGTVAPVEGEGLTAVVDPGLPAWLRERTEQAVPRLFSFYASRTGYPLRIRPVVFVSYTEDTRPGTLATNGGVLPGLVQMEVRLGRDFQKEEDAVVAERLFHLIAHEAAHLWNTQLFHHEVNGGDWMHEGGAEAFAHRALRELGLLSEAAYRARLSDAVSACLFGLEGRPLAESSQRGAFRNHYTCGWVLGLVAEAHARQGAPQTDLFTLWRRMFEATDSAGRYDDRLYFQTLTQAGVPARTVEVLHGLTQEPTHQADMLIPELLRTAGYTLEVDDAGAAPDFKRQVALRAVRLALARTCDKPSLTPGKDAVEVRAGSCPALGESSRVVQLGGHPLLQEPLAAYDALVAQCGGSGTISVHLAGAAAPLPLRCEPQIPRRTPYLRVQHAP